MHIFQCIGKILCVEFQRGPLKFHTKYLTHTLKDAILIQPWHFKSSWIKELISVFETPPLGKHWLRPMASFLTASIHYQHHLNQYGLITSEVLWHSPEGNLTGNAQNIYPWQELENRELIIMIPVIQFLCNSTGKWKFDKCHKLHTVCYLIDRSSSWLSMVDPQIIGHEVDPGGNSPSMPTNALGEIRQFSCPINFGSKRTPRTSPLRAEVDGAFKSGRNWLNSKMCKFRELPK